MREVSFHLSWSLALKYGAGLGEGSIQSTQHDEWRDAMSKKKGSPVVTQEDADLVHSIFKKMVSNGTATWAEPHLETAACVQRKEPVSLRTTAKQRAQQERDAAREELRAIVRPGDTVYCVLRHTSRSGMQRVIDLQVLTTDDSGRPWLRTIGGLAARAMGDRYDYQRGGVVVGGCGMDMGFHLVYSLGYALWPKGFGCVGERCRSNDHSNGDRDYTPHGAPVVKSHWKAGGRAVEHWHKDGGYTLKHEWV